MVMSSEVVEHPSFKKPDWILNINDRCDRCSAQAFVKVVGVTGDLLFCSHHYNKIMDNAVGYDAMIKFAYEVIDEREKLQENKLIGSHNQ